MGFFFKMHARIKSSAPPIPIDGDYPLLSLGFPLVSFGTGGFGRRQRAESRCENPTDVHTGVGTFVLLSFYRLSNCPYTFQSGLTALVHVFSLRVRYSMTASIPSRTGAVSAITSAEHQG